MKLLSVLLRIRSGDRWLLSVAACCTAILAAELLWPHPLRWAGAPEEFALPETQVGAFWQPGFLAEYEAIVARPLFTVDRRPFVAPLEEFAPQPEPPAPSVQFVLTAIVTSAEARIALLRTSSSPEVLKMSVDQTIDGWTLVEVREDAVVLSNGAEIRIVELAANRAQSRLDPGVSGAFARGQ